MPPITRRRFGVLMGGAASLALGGCELPRFGWVLRGAVQDTAYQIQLPRPPRELDRRTLQGRLEARLASALAAAKANTQASGDHPSLREASNRLRQALARSGVALAATAKGYGVDRLAAELDTAGIAHYRLDLGSTSRFKGVNDAGYPWPIAIERPGGNTSTPLREVTLRDAAVATVGDDRKPSPASIAVVADHGALAETLAMGLWAMGPEEGFALARGEGIAALFAAYAPNRRRFIQRTTSAFETRTGPLQGLNIHFM
ncbi:MAG: FAD:protein FMN transferase [Candidatus Competibacterales bacterium]